MHALIILDKFYTGMSIYRGNDLSANWKTNTSNRTWEVTSIKCQTQNPQRQSRSSTKNG